MKKIKIIFGAAVLLLCFAFICIILSVRVIAQPLGSANAATTDTLAKAINLLNDGQLKAAKALLATIDSTDPEYPAAQCYLALCLYEQNDFPGFLKQMELPAVKQAAISPEMGEDLGVKQIDALFKYRKFDQLLSQVDSFQSNFPDSLRMPMVAEYQMATLVERGMKKAIDAKGLTSQDEVIIHWTEARTNLNQFLSMTSSLPGTNYSFLSDRILKEDIWLARMILGDDQAALADIPALDTNALKRFSFLRIQLFAEKLYPRRIDQNLKLMADYLGKFPASDDRARVVCDMAEFSFRKGEILSSVADAAEQSGGAKMAAEMRASASQYFNQQRTLQSQIVTNRAAGIEESDVLDAHEDLLYSYYLEKNYDHLISLTSSTISESKPGDLNWIMAKAYKGFALPCCR